MADVKILDKKAEDDDPLDYIDFSSMKEIENPFRGMMKNGYDTIIHYGPKADRDTDMYCIDNAIARITYLIYDKMHDVPSENLQERLDEILKTIESL